MTIKIRSSAGNFDTNDTTPEVDSPATITASDLLVCIWLINDNNAQTISAPAGWAERDTVTDFIDTRYVLFTKIATETDVTNAGTADYYVFGGMDGADDVLYGIFSLYDDAGASVSYNSGSLSGNADSGANTTTSAPTQTIATDNELVLCAWAAVNGSSLSNISAGESFSFGTNPALYQDSWSAKGMANASWSVGTTEVATADSPTGTLDLTHIAVGADSEQYSVSATFVAAAAVSSGRTDGAGRGIMRGVGRGI